MSMEVVRSNTDQSSQIRTGEVNDVNIGRLGIIGVELRESINGVIEEPLSVVLQGEMNILRDLATVMEKYKIDLSLYYDIAVKRGRLAFDEIPPNISDNITLEDKEILRNLFDGCYVYNLPKIKPNGQSAVRILGKAMTAKERSDDRAKKGRRNFKNNLRIIIQDDFEDIDFEEKKGEISNFIENIFNKPNPNKYNLSLWRITVFNGILSVIGKSTSDCTDEQIKIIRDFVDEIEDKLGVQDIHMELVKLVQEYQETLTDFELPVVWGYARTRLLQIRYFNMPSSLKHLKNPDLDEAPVDLPTLEEEGEKMLKKIMDTATEINKKFKLDTDKFAKHRALLESTNIDELVDIIKRTMPRTEEEYDKLKYAKIRMHILYIAEMLCSGNFNTKSAEIITDALVRRLGILKFFRHRDNAGSKPIFTLRQIKNVKLIIGDPKENGSAARKIAIKPPGGNGDPINVIYDSARMTFIIDDEVWKQGEEAIKLKVTEILAWLVPVIGTDFVEEKFKCALNVGEKTKASSTGKKQSMQMTFIIKSVKDRKSKLGSVEIQFVSSKQDEEERAEFENNQMQQVYDKLGINTDFYQYLKSLIDLAIDTTRLYGTNDPRVIREIEDVRTKAKALDIGPIEDPLTDVYRKIIYMLGGGNESRMKIIAHFKSEIARNKNSERILLALKKNLEIIHQIRTIRQDPIIVLCARSIDTINHIFESTQKPVPAHS